MKKVLLSIISGVFLLLLIFSCKKNSTASTPPVSPDPNLVAYYSFSGNAKDSTSFHNDGQVNGAVLIADRNGNPNQAYYFNGSSSYIYIPGQSNLDIKGSFSIAAWINPELICGPGGGCYIMWRGDAQGAHDPYALYTNSNAIGVRKDVETGGTLNQSLFPTTTELLNKWSHVTGVYDSSLNIAKVYIDGNLVQQKTFSTSAINYSTLGFWNNIGAAQNNMGFFKGSIDEVRIYDKVLSENEIQKLATSN